MKKEKSVVAGSPLASRPPLPPDPLSLRRLRAPPADPRLCHPPLPNPESATGQAYEVLLHPPEILGWLHHWEQLMID